MDSKTTKEKYTLEDLDRDLKKNIWYEIDDLYEDINNYKFAILTIIKNKLMELLEDNYAEYSSQFIFNKRVSRGVRGYKLLDQKLKNGTSHWIYFQITIVGKTFLISPHLWFLNGESVNANNYKSQSKNLLSNKFSIVELDSNDHFYSQMPITLYNDETKILDIKCNADVIIMSIYQTILEQNPNIKEKNIDGEFSTTNMRKILTDLNQKVVDFNKKRNEFIDEFFIELSQNRNMSKDFIFIKDWDEEGENDEPIIDIRNIIFESKETSKRVLILTFQYCEEDGDTKNEHVHFTRLGYIISGVDEGKIHNTYFNIGDNITIFIKNYLPNIIKYLEKL